ncbi:MAG TPA: MltA domain-containing protein [Caulobacteraceae bacterium]|jgi:membrane-bound lytic murein transglycosylase A
MAALPGWEGEDHATAFAVVRRACAESRRLAASRACADALRHDRLGERAAKTLLERDFRAEPAGGEGLLTAYFAPTYDARHRRDREFCAPVRPAPADPASAPDRAGIDRWPTGEALAWMRPEDLFFLQVQGSGALVFPDGERERAVFAASNGQPFVAIARPMIAEGLIAPAEAGQVHAWLAAHRGPDAEAAIALDPRYVFFRLIADDDGEPRGAAGVPLIPGRSVAIDTAAHPFFELLWIDAGGGALPGARAGYHRLAIAHDIGGAIKGPVRADLYIGRGPRAGEEAASVSAALRLYRIVPAD